MLGIGVAPFELAAPPGELAPDLSGLLAQRLGTLGVDRVVGPEALGAAPLSAPSDDVVMAWARESQVAVVVVGRTTRVGSVLNVDLWLRSGASGGVADRYATEISNPEGIEPAIDRLAGLVVKGAATLAASTAARTAPSTKSSSPFDFAGFDRDAPLTIRSEALDAFQHEGRRQLVFTREVKVTQADLILTADRLEALYPEKSSQPDQLIARGRVVMVRGAREARCQEAIYYRIEGRLVCRGEAELREGGDLVRGQVIEFDVETDRVTVSGGASVLLTPQEDTAHEGADPAQPDGSPDVGASP